MDLLQEQVIRDAGLMKFFAGEDKTFRLGEWLEWKRACQIAGETLNPEDFKKKNAQQK